MPRRGSRNQGNTGNQNQIRFQQQQNQVIGCTIQYTRALLKGDEPTLERMTLYSHGVPTGGSSSNIAMLQQYGAKRVAGITAHKKIGVALFEGDNGEITCVGVFPVLDGSHVMGDWKVFGTPK